MSLLVVGINHKSAPVRLRERVAFTPDNTAAAITALATLPAVNERLIVSTCNRTELYFSTDATEDVATRLVQWLADFHQLSLKEVRKYLYLYRDEQCARHLMRVACGLDSMVLGEPQILGQLKQSFSAAREAHGLGGPLERLFQHSFGVAKQVRTDTAIGESAVSVAFAGVVLARHIFDDFSQIQVLLVGAGETIELTARHLMENGVRQITVANRTASRAQALATQFAGQGIGLQQLHEALPDADIVISSTGSTLPIIGKGMVEYAIKKRRHAPVFMLDLAVPRDIEEEVAQLDDVYLYTVDDLEHIIEGNVRARQMAAQAAESIIDDQLEQFMRWLRGLSAVSTIRQLRQQSESVQQTLTDKALRQLRNGAEAEEVVRQLGHQLTRRLLHAPTKSLRRAGEEGRQDTLEHARQLFELPTRSSEDNS